MPSDDRQTTAPPIEKHADPKPAVTDPRDDLHEQVAAHRRDLQAYFACHASFLRNGRNTPRH